MKALVSGLVVVALIACGPAGSTSTASTSSPASVSAKRAAIEFGGLTRSYFVFRPAALEAKTQVPLVLALHGFTEPATDLEARTRLNHAAVANGFEVVYPQGVQNSWNAGTCCGYARSQNLDDVGFISALIAHLVAGGGIDPMRVFVTGLSNGAFMSYRLACELSDRILAIASDAGTMVSGLTTCHPQHPVSVLEIHGTADSIVPYDGSENDSGPFPPVTDVVKSWVANDQCAGQGATTRVGIVTTDLWSTCAAGTIVKLVTIDGAGHTWFGAQPNEPAGEPDATELVSDFFSHLPART